MLFNNNMFYQNQTIFGPLAEFGDLRGTVHPYFAPRTFNYFETRIDWTHQLGRDFFAHSNQCYYNLQYGLGYDNEGITYNQFRGLLNWDIKPWLSFGMEGRYTYSSVYRFGTIGAYLVWRMPFGQF